jgi:hypothetical protein
VFPASSETIGCWLKLTCLKFDYVNNDEHLEYNHVTDQLVNRRNGIVLYSKGEWTNLIIYKNTTNAESQYLQIMSEKLDTIIHLLENN